MTEKVYISGQMSGLSRPEYLRRFRVAEKMVRAHGYRTVNPARFLFCRWPWLYRLMGYRLALLFDLWMLDRHCRRIYLIPGWEQSRGARIESFFAHNMGIRRLPQEIKNQIDKDILKIINK